MEAGVTGWGKGQGGAVPRGPEVVVICGGDGWGGGGSGGGGGGVHGGALTYRLFPRRRRPTL